MVLLTHVVQYCPPQFEIVPEEDPQNAIVASSALTCHSNLLKAIASVRYQSSPLRLGLVVADWGIRHKLTKKGFVFWDVVLV